MLLLSTKQMSAPENMLYDAMFLDSWAHENSARLRFYFWDEPSYTCGISQRASDFAGIIPSGSRICRRPTGGGLVFHNNADLTYALVVPAYYDFFKIRPRDSYFMLHERIGAAAAVLGIKSSILKASLPYAGPAQCFKDPSSGDLMSQEYGKFAGAAQKRTRKGILLQGSIKFPNVQDSSALSGLIAREIAGLFGEQAEARPIPSFECRAWDMGIAHFAPELVP